MEFKKQTNGTRVRTFFAWLPVTVEKDDFTITRWLEKVTIEEKYIEGLFHPGYWNTIKFIDEPIPDTTETDLENILDFLTCEKSKFSIMYGNQEKRFATNKKDYTIKEFISIWKKTKK